MFRYLKYAAIAALFPLLGGADSGCNYKPSSNDIQREQQERMLTEGTAQTGMPAIKNFRERKLLKEIFELRDQTGLVTYTYFFNEMTGKIGDKLCDSIGYPFPYATQYTAPESVQRYYLKGDNSQSNAWGSTRLPQADPNGLFSPSSADGTWVMCKDPNSDAVRPVYSEPKVVAFPFKHDAQ